MENQTNRIPCLDGLRAISIFIVVLSHICAGLNFKDIFYLTGNSGVRIFFVISGFLITSILIAEFERDSAINLKKFYFRRIFRIFPAYFFFLGMLFLLNLILKTYPPTNFIYSFSYTSNYFFPKVPFELGHTWSLAVKEQFYLIFPLVLSFVGLFKFKKFVLAIIIITPLLRLVTVLISLFLGEGNTTSYGDFAFISIAWNFHINMDILATGCFLALYRNSLHKNNVYKRFLNSNLLFLFLLAFIVSLGYFSDGYLIAFYMFGMTLMNFSIIFCIDWLIVNHESLFGKFLNLKPLRFVGVLSYSIYLWQQIFATRSEMFVWTHLPYNLIFILLCALFSYYFVEKTFLAYRQKLEKGQLFKRYTNLAVKAQLIKL